LEREIRKQRKKGAKQEGKERKKERKRKIKRGKSSLSLAEERRNAITNDAPEGLGYRDCR